VKTTRKSVSSKQKILAKPAPQKISLNGYGHAKPTYIGKGMNYKDEEDEDEEEEENNMD
jgi:hypothetical protein